MYKQIKKLTMTHSLFKQQQKERENKRHLVKKNKNSFSMPIKKEKKRNCSTPKPVQLATKMKSLSISEMTSKHKVPNTLQKNSRSLKDTSKMIEHNVPNERGVSLKYYFKLTK